MPSELNDGPLSLDAIDTQLLEELQRDAKLSLKEIGERVGLSAPAVMERVRKLEQAGAITGYHAKIDARRVGVDVAALIGVTIATPDDMAEFERHVDRELAVLECHHVTGRHTVMIKVRVPTTADLERLISEMRKLSGVTATETMVVLSTSHERVPVPVAAPRDEPRRRRPARR